MAGIEKATFSLQTRVDIRKVAALGRFYSIKSQYPPRSKSELIRMIVDDFHDLLEENGMLVPVLTTTEGKRMLMKQGISRSGEVNRSMPQFLKQVRMEAGFAREAGGDVEGEVDMGDAATEALQRIEEGG